MLKGNPTNEMRKVTSRVRKCVCKLWMRYGRYDRLKFDCFPCNKGLIVINVSSPTLQQLTPVWGCCREISACFNVLAAEPIIRFYKLQCKAPVGMSSWHFQHMTSLVAETLAYFAYCDFTEKFPPLTKFPERKVSIF